MSQISIIKRIMMSSKYMYANILLCFALFILIQHMEKINVEFEASSYDAKNNYIEDQIEFSRSIFLKVLMSVLLFLSNLCTIQLISSCNQIAHKEILGHYLDLKYQAFQRLKVAVIQCLIFRRSMAITEMVALFFTKLFPKIVFLFISFASLNCHLDLLLSVKIGFLLLVFLAIILWFQKIRSNMRASINSCYEVSDSKKLDILVNYERIIAYDSLNIELESYEKCLQKYTRRKQIYEMQYNLMGLVSALYLFGVFYYIVRATGSQSNISNRTFLLITLLVLKSKDTIFLILKDFDAIFIIYSNFKYSKTGKNDYEANQKKYSIQIDYFKNRLEFHNCWVSFGEISRLRNMKFSINKGSKVAIIGDNGSGKSIFAKMLVGLIEYQGSIKIDGFELRNINKESKCHLVGYIPQNVSIFNSTILDNLKTGANHISDQKLIEICKLFNCHDIFYELGYSKVVGDGGRYLSGGQKQRVALLRAIVKNSQILVFDNAFNGLDQISEKNFVNSIVTNLNDKTIFCVLQNLNLLSYFDQILFFNNTVVESGTYQELYCKSIGFKRYIERKDL